MNRCRRKVIKRALAFAAVGAAASLTSLVCLLAIPAWPGAALAEALGAGPVLTCGGPRLSMLVPANAAVYGAMGAMLGYLRGLAGGRRDAHRRGRCCKCRYDLRGLPQPRCPECGTPFVPPPGEGPRL